MRNSFILFLVFILSFLNGSAQNTCNNDTLPFVAGSSHIMVWSGNQYEPLLIKGINFGVALPGKFPGQLAVSREQYWDWLSKAKGAGFNAIRLYTLHFPHFYEILDSFNRLNSKSPLLVMQGVWLEEEVPGYKDDLLTLKGFFEQEIRENVDVVHGNKTIAPRVGKAYGTYTADISKWVIGYIIGREVHPEEVIKTNHDNAAVQSYAGQYLSITGATPSECFVTGALDYILKYESDNYHTSRPVSFSSWPTLDPIKHIEEYNRYEDTAKLDLILIDRSMAPAGLFISYHAYPYYPDFVSKDPKYSNFQDDLGPNSYLGYLKDLKSHYKDMPLIIAEYGVPSSWVCAHYSSSGMHHGGLDEKQQGEMGIRLFQSIVDAGGGGGIQFALIDEWFKRTWIADPLDFEADRRILWQNLASAEQNFGLIGYRKPQSWQFWDSLCSSCIVPSVSASIDYAAFNLRFTLDHPLSLTDTLWVAFDTYDSLLGESVLPTRDTIENRAEFLLRITNFSAELYVTEAYDTYGIWHKIAGNQQLFKSVQSDKGVWKILRWRNNNFFSDVQYIGNMGVHKGGTPMSSKDAVSIWDDHIDVRIPWNYLQFIDPSAHTVLHDDRSTDSVTETRTSDGIKITVMHSDFIGSVNSRFNWPRWDSVAHVEEYEKLSYKIIKARLPEFNNVAITRCDNYTSYGMQPLAVTADSGVLANDLDFDGNEMIAVLVSLPEHGTIDLDTSGSFVYTSDPDFKGIDEFTYCIFDGKSLSEPASVSINVLFASYVGKNTSSTNSVAISPNPARDEITVSSDKGKISAIRIVDNLGKIVYDLTANDRKVKVQLPQLASGIYNVITTVGNSSFSTKILISE